MNLNTTCRYCLGPSIKYVRPKAVIKICFCLTPTPPLYKRILVTHFQNTMNVKNPGIWSKLIHKDKSLIDNIGYFGLICYSFVFISLYQYTHNLFFSKAYIRYCCDQPLPLYTKSCFWWYPPATPKSVRTLCMASLYVSRFIFCVMILNTIYEKFLIILDPGFTRGSL